MDGLSWSLLAATSGIAIAHTVLGPDHYLPFIMLARARGWSSSRTVTVTALCGAGHVLSSILLGGLGIVFGVTVARLDWIEAGRGGFAAWALVAFGLAYGAWGARKAFRRSRGVEAHDHGGHVHVHVGGARLHTHQRNSHDKETATTFWALFAIFILGPCEPMIPLFVLPASRGRWDLAVACALVFAVVTVGGMVGLTMLGVAGLRPIRMEPVERWSHALAGGVIAAAGSAIIFLGF